MRSDKSKVISGMTLRQKVTAGVLVLIIIIIIWQAKGLFGGGSKTAVTPLPAVNKAAAPSAMSAQQATPQSTEIMKVQPATSQREMELMRLQQETQAKYIAALNDLQMLKVTREIAETNQAIIAAQLATVTAQKNIVNLLAPQQQVSPADYARGLVNPVTSGNQVRSAPPTQVLQPEVTYSVVSVSQLQYRWHAVLGYQGRLYNVLVGDVLPADGSTVKSIDKSGVILEKDGVRKKISLVPII